MYTQSVEILHKNLKEGKINHLQFLMTSEYSKEFKRWCKSINEAPDEKNAEMFYDMNGFSDMDVEKIIVSEAV